MRTSRFFIAGLCAAAISLIAVHHARGGSDHLRGTIRIDGRERTYLLHLPSGYTPGQPRPLVLSLHGRLGDGKGQARLSHFDTVSDEHGLLVVYPDGLDRSWADGRAASPSDKKGVDDVKFMSELIDKLSREYSIDRNRIYATGMSNGGFMTGRLACELSGKIAAVAIVAASLSDNTAAACHPRNPVSVLVMQGTADPLVPFSGGPLGKKGERGNILSHSATVEKWLQLNACLANPKTEHILDKVGDGTSIDIQIYSPCRSGREVEDYVINDGGHAWPGGLAYLGDRWIGKTSKNLDASEAIWNFFATNSR